MPEFNKNMAKLLKFYKGLEFCNRNGKSENING